MQATLAWKPKTLFYPYLIVPFVLLFLLIAHYYYPALLHKLPRAPQQIFLLGILLEKPHIVASTLTMLDDEYLSHFKSRLVWGLLILALASMVLSVFQPVLFLAIFFGWTVYHVIKQQLGIGRMLNMGYSRAYETWGWLFIITSLAIAFGIGYITTTPSESVRSIVAIVIYSSCSLALIAAVAAWRQMASQTGKYYLLANCALLVASIILFNVGIAFFSILLPRIVHDATAYLIYIDHDTNRNTPMARQWIYRALTPLQLPIWVTCVGVSVILAAIITYGGVTIFAPIATFLAIYHYYSESFIWKRDSPFRNSLHFNFQPQTAS